MKPWLLILGALWLGTTASHALGQARQPKGASRNQVPAAATSHGDPTPAAERPSSSEERDRQARLEFERGRKAFDEGDYRGAWGFFHSAYRLSGRAQLLYNIGQTADRLGHDSEALTAFQMYLERLPEADNRRDVENRIRALEQRVREAQRVQPPSEAPPEAEGSTLPQPAAAEPQFQPVTSSGQVDTAPPPPPEAADDAPRPTRRGFYARLGLGLGFRRDGVSGGTEGSVTGAGLASELALGTTLFPGFVIGGAFYSDLASSPTFETQGGAKVELGSAHVTMFGPMADWYLNHDSNGFHVQAALTFAVLAIDYQAAGVSVGRDASGIGLMLGAGYEWAVAAEWAVGALFRLTLASMADDTRSHGIFAPSLVATVTWF